MATVGNTAMAGGSTRSCSGNARGILVTVPVNFTINFIRTHIDDTGTANTWAAHIYSETGALTGDLETSSSTRSDITSAGTYDFSGFSAAEFPAGDYWIIAGANNADASANMYYGAESIGGVNIGGGSWNPAAPTDPATFNDDPTRPYDIYLDYTEAAGGSNANLLVGKFGALLTGKL